MSQVVCVTRVEEISTKSIKGASAMKIAVSSTGVDLHDLVDPRFSRCRYYIIYDVSTGSYVSKENTSGMH